ncbi:MAG: elongation factor G [Oscillospiraceae bacterium]|nr:elongation factor G [Oscillospiraceae bacterium]
MTSNIRNLCLMGHGGDGKTSLAESMLWLTKGSDRLGKVTDGNTVSDFEPEEVRRQISLSASLLPVNYAGVKLNIIDTPGFLDFVGETLQGLRVSEACLIVLGGKSGVGVGTERAWKLAAKKPRMLYISKMDEENADYHKTFEALRAQFGISVCPVVIPIIESGKFTGIVDIVTHKAYKCNGAKVEEIPVPASMEDSIEEMYALLAENVAETSEELMEKYFGGDPFSPEELKAGIAAGVASLSLTPVFCGSAVTGLGTEALMRGICDYVSDPTNAPPEIAADDDGNEIEVPRDPDGPCRLFVFKTLSDQYGKFSFFKVVSGRVSGDTTLVNARTGANEKLGRLQLVKGKTKSETGEFCCGDIGAVAKLTDTKTGDSLCAPGNLAALSGIDFPPPCYSLAFAPKVKGGEEKISAGLTRMSEEDLTFTMVQNVETKQLVVTGQGDIHLDVLCAKLKGRFGVEVETEAPRVAYREKIRKKVTGIEGKHKKQSGGHGQFGLVIMDFEPGESEELIFEEKVFGGSVPKQYFPAVEKGLRDCIQRGILAGYPLVHLKATLTDGKHHEVDSSEMAFKLASRLAYKAGLPQANPVLLEPVGMLRVFIPDQYMGDIISDLNKRRGRVMGMSPGEDKQQIVEAEVPMAEMSSYAIDLRSMTQGRGSFTLEFQRYEETPASVQQKVIEETRQLQEEED